jgi:general secretion pathway protein G
MLRGVNSEDGFETLCAFPRAGRARTKHARAALDERSAGVRCQRRVCEMCGFTLLEMMIVISIILILIAVAVPVYTQSILRSREAVLRQDLFTLRSVISQYTLDKQKAPQSLDDVVQAGYLRQIPPDPLTGQANWEVVQEDVLLAVDQQDPGISDVHSASNATASDGTAYSSW